MRALPFLSLYLSTIVKPQQFTSAQERTLLNAYKTPLSLLTAPGNYYFLEFPLQSPDSNENDQGLQPICGNGSPYSFVYKRGTDEHISKLLIEFEGGEACWEEGSCTCGSDAGSTDVLARNNRETPWYNYLQNLEEGITAEGYFPTLDQCRGIESGFVQTGSGYLFGNDMFDVPIALRGLSEDTSDVTDVAQEWWEALGGSKSSNDNDVRDWSYLLLPHCTLDWHLGHRKDPVATGCNLTNEDMEETVYHRGGVNIEFVKDWITQQFDSLDALVVTSGGTVGGCHSSDLSQSAKHTSSIAPAFLGTRLTSDLDLPKQDTDNSILVLLDGSNLFNPKLPSYIDMVDRWNTVDISSNADGNDGSTLRNMMDFMIENAYPQMQYAWLASELGGETSFTIGAASETLREESEEEMWLSRVKSKKPNQFHVFVPNDVDVPPDAICPFYAFPNLPSSDREGVRNFVGEVTNLMSWSVTDDTSQANATTESAGGFHPTFLTLALCNTRNVAAKFAEYNERRTHLIRERMKSAYKAAGSMMLVSSMTTSICFFSNAFSVLVVIQEFGIFMGMVVLLNYVHVMTILPSAILVNELYVLPYQTRLKAKLFGDRCNILTRNILKHLI